MRLILVRHGESAHGLNGVIAEMAGCTGLTEHGLRQVEALGNRLVATGELNDCWVLLSSPVLRARQTAELLARQLSQAAVQEVRNLCELHPGNADGLTWEDYRARYGEFDLVSDPRRAFAPAGESWAEFLRRVRVTLERLADHFDGQTIVAVTHAGFIVASLLVLFDIPRPGTGARLDPVHTSLTEWCASGAAWRLSRYNDACHLFTTF